MESPVTSTLSLDLTSESSKSTINLQFRVRNILLGSVGILANILAFFIILRSTKVKEGRKLLLLSLIFSDAACAVALLVYGVDETTQISEGEGCLPMMFTIILAVQNAYTVCLLLSIVNFLAVYKPFQFEMLVSWRNTGIAVSICSLAMAGCTYWWVVAHHIHPGLTCAPIVIMPDPGLIGFSTVMLVSSLGVFGLNAAVVFNLKKRSRFRLAASTSRSDQTILKNPVSHRRVTRESDRERSIFSRVLQAFGKSKVNKVKPSDVVVEKQRDQLPTVSSIWMGDNVSEASSGTSHQATPHVTLGLAPSTSQPPLSSSSGRNIDDASDTNPTVEPEGIERVEQSSLTQIGSTTNRNTVKDSVCNDLVILTSFSCIITLPIAIYLICIAEGIIEDPEFMVGTAVGIFVSSGPVSKAVINPFFYVLRFVSWRNMFKNICTNLKI